MKKKKKRLLKDEIKEKLIYIRKQSKICKNLRELHKFTRLQTKRIGAFKERSTSAQHKISTCRQNGIMIDQTENRWRNAINNNEIISKRKFSNINVNDTSQTFKRSKVK